MFNWTSFLIYAIVTAATPGPNNIMSMSNAGRKGFCGALPFNLGIGVGFFLVMLLCTVCCSTLSAAIPTIKTPMLLLGAAYITYLAWETWNSRYEHEGAVSQHDFRTGLLLQFINPKIYIYCIMSMEAYILPVYQGKELHLLGFAIFLTLIGNLFTLCWAAFGSAFKWLFSAHAGLVNSVMAVLLLYCAASLFLA